MIELIGKATVLANIAMWRTTKTDEEVNKALVKLGAKIESSAKNLCPVDTGALRASLYFQMNSDTELQVGDGKEYGIYLEKGTSRQKPQPFLMPAVQGNIKEFENYLKGVF